MWEKQGSEFGEGGFNFGSWPRAAHCLGSRAGASVGSGKGCGRGATAANGVKPTLTSLLGWGRRAGLGVHAGLGHRRPCYSKPLALASDSEGRGGPPFHFLPSGDVQGSVFAALRCTSPKSARTP